MTDVPAPRDHVDDVHNLADRLGCAAAMLP
jgi:hypothetical protein